jgi:hypothetical protein
MLQRNVGLWVLVLIGRFVSQKVIEGFPEKVPMTTHQTSNRERHTEKVAWGTI